VKLPALRLNVIISLSGQKWTTICYSSAVFARLIGAAVLVILPACSGESTAVVARAHRLGAENPPLGGDNAAAIQGPNGYLWWPYVDDSDPARANASWLSQPPNNANSVSVQATHQRDYRAGLAFQFFADNSTRDLSQFTNVELTVELIEGDRFELFLGRGPNEGCSYVFYKGDSSGPQFHSRQLSQADWCVPTQCGFNLQVNGGYFLAHVPSDSPLKATLTDLHFTTDSSGARSGSANALGGGRGPGNFCWYLGKWTEGVTVNWKHSYVTSSSAEAYASSPANAGAGIDFEIPKDFNLGQYRWLNLDATISDMNSPSGSADVLVQAVKQNSGRSWSIQGDGKRRTYRLDLTNPEWTFMDPVALDEVERFEIVNRYGGRGFAINVQGVQFTK
jgi:hypothetical protein